MARQSAKTKTAPAQTGNKMRRLKVPHYRTLRLHHRIKPVTPRLTGAFHLFGRSVGHLKQHWKLFGGILLIFAVLKLLLGIGLNSSLSLGTLKPSLDQLFHGSLGRLSAGVALFGLLLSSTGSAPSPSSSAYQAVLVLAVSLALVWALRQTLANKAAAKIRIRDTFYKGMYPAVPFLLVLIVIGLQLLPLMIGGSLYNIVLSSGIAVTAIEKALWALLFFLTGLLSLYMISSSLFALYIVTLPDMTPMKALRSARQLVLHRRWVVARKVLFLPVALLVIAAVLIIPIIVFAARLAEGAFFIYATIGLAVIHSYMYHLYRELL